jgi:hypothetical protein
MAVTCQLLTVEFPIWSDASPYGFCGGQSSTGQVSHRVLGFLPCWYHSIIAPYKFIHYQHVIVLAVDSIVK